MGLSGKWFPVSAISTIILLVHTDSDRHRRSATTDYKSGVSICFSFQFKSVVLFNMYVANVAGLCVCLFSCCAWRENHVIITI